MTSRILEGGVTFHRWDDMPKERVNDMLDRRLIAGDRMMLAHVYLKKGCVVPKHSHENEQLTYILEGALLFTLGEDQAVQVTVSAGEVLHIPPIFPTMPRLWRIRSTSTSSAHRAPTG